MVWRTLDVQRSGQGLQVLVNWEGYGHAECSWVPWHQNLDEGLVRYFYQAHPDKPGEGPAEREGLSWCSSDGVLVPFRVCVLNFLHEMHG